MISEGLLFNLFRAKNPEQCKMIFFWNNQTLIDLLFNSETKINEGFNLIDFSKPQFIAEVLPELQPVPDLLPCEPVS